MTAVNYLWDPVEQNIVRELDDSGNVVAQYTTEPGLYGDLLSQRRNGEDSYYHYDGQGSTVALTNSMGDVTDTYEYSAFGEVTEHTGSTVNPFQYIGRKQYYLDQEQGLINVRRRDLSPFLGGWLSVDPVVWFHDAVMYWYIYDTPYPRDHAYGYVDARPIMFIDPSGYDKCTVEGSPCAKVPAVGAQPDGWYPVFSGTYPAPDMRVYLFGQFQLPYVAKENIKDGCLCKCCQFELWVKGKDADFLNGVQLPPAMLIGSMKPISDTEMRQDSPTIDPSKPDKDGNCIFMKGKVQMYDRPGFIFDRSKVVGGKAVYKVDYQRSFEARIYDICEDPKKLIRTDKYQFKMRGEADLLIPGYEKKFQWWTDLKACK